MTKNLIIGGASALLITGAASADFIGFDGFVSTNTQGNTVVELYALYDNSDAVVLNIFNAEASTATGGSFVHNDVQTAAGGTWNPTASLDIPGFSDVGNDSFVTIGYGGGATDGTALDPNFGSGLGGVMPSGAGWYNGNPNNPQGVTAFDGGVIGLIGYATMIGQFVFTESNLLFTAEIGANTGPGTDVSFGSGQFGYIPAPGALALLGMGGITTRRRRR